MRSRHPVPFSDAPRQPIPSISIALVRRGKSSPGSVKTTQVHNTNSEDLQFLGSYWFVVLSKGLWVWVHVLKHQVNDQSCERQGVSWIEKQAGLSRTRVLLT